MDDLDANICDLPTELKALILSHVDGVATCVALASVSRTWRNAARLPESRPARYDTMLLRVLRESCLSLLKDHWPESQAPEEWGWVRMEDNRVVRLNVPTYPWPLLAVPAVIGQFTSLRELSLRGHKLTSLPAEIGQLVSLEELDLRENKLTRLPPEIGQLTSLRDLSLERNQLTSLPAEIGQLISLKGLYLSGNRLTSLPAEVGQLASLRQLDFYDNQLTRLPAVIRELRAAGCKVGLSDGVTFDE